MANAYFKSKNPIERKISNLSYSKFFFEGRECHSIEGWYQGIKSSGEEIQNEKFKSFGMMAKKLSKPTRFIYWNGKKIKAGTQEHWDLIFEAQKCKYTQDKDAKEALLATGNAKITHNVGGKDSVFYPAKIYCKHLTQIRNMLQKGEI